MEWKRIDITPPENGRYLVLVGCVEDNIQEALYGGGKWLFRNEKYQKEPVNWYTKYPRLPWQKEGE